MKAIRLTLFVLIVTLLSGTSVYAQTAPSMQPNTLSAHDLKLLFEQDGEPMQLALLSEQEMTETKGAIIPLLIARSTFGGIGGAGVYLVTHLGTGRFYWDGFTAYMITGALTANGVPGVTTGGEIILGGMAAAIVARWYEARRN